MGVKLRVRVAGVSGPALALEVPETCTLAQLRQKIAAKVLADLPGWGPGVAESDVEVSLNGDEDLGAAGHNESATLRACGVTRGDLIRVKRREGSGADVSAAGGHASAGNVPAANESRSVPTRDETADEMRRNAAAAAERRAFFVAGTGADARDPEVSTDDARAAVPMELGTDDEPPPPPKKPKADAEDARRLLLPSALRDALFVNRGSTTSAPTSGPTSSSSSSSITLARDDAALLFIATHAALLETGLVRVSGDGDDAHCDAFSLPAGWRESASRTGAYRARYALEKFQGKGFACLSVKAQSPDGSTLVVCGGVEGGGTNENARVALLDANEWLSTRSTDVASDVSLCYGRFADNEKLRGSWSRLKDSFASRLVDDARVFCGLPPRTPGLSALPDDLKVAVLSRVPLDDFKTLCSASAVCREMRFAADADALWQTRFEARFGRDAFLREKARRENKVNESNRTADSYDHVFRWKSAFAEATVEARREALRRAREAAELAARAARFFPGMPGVPFNPGFGDPRVIPHGPPGYTPGITGGDYDLYPGGGRGFGFGGAMPGFPGGGTPGFGGGGYTFPQPDGGWPLMPGGMPGGVPTPTPGGGLGNGRRGLGRGRGSGFPNPTDPPMPGWDGRPRPPGAPDGDGFL